MNDKLSLIPEVFFDVIGRFVPGTVFLCGIGWVAYRAGIDLPDVPGWLSGGLITLLALPCMWLIGLLLSVASNPILDYYNKGFKPMKDLLRHDMDQNRRKARITEKIAGWPVTWLEGDPKLFDPERSAKIKQAIKGKFDDDAGDQSFWACFDYVRRNVPSAGPGVVKIFAEATCARSLILGFSIIAGFALCRYDFGAAVVALVLAMCSSATFSHYRVQGCRRMLLALLEPAEPGGTTTAPTDATPLP